MSFSRQAKLQEDTYVRVLRLLEETPDLSQRDMAKALGISLGGVNYCLVALIEKGLLKVENFRRNKNGRIGYLYILTPEGLKKKAELTALFLARKMVEYEELKEVIDNLKNEVRLGE
jgi:EPS-associated MarR family transcriptional regulator